MTNLKIAPMEGPIVKFTDKATGENYMGRKVALSEGDKTYECFAVSNANDPTQTTLMNKDQFIQTIADNVPEVTRHQGDTFAKKEAA